MSKQHQFSKPREKKIKENIAILLVMTCKKMGNDDFGSTSMTFHHVMCSYFRAKDNLILK